MKYYWILPIATLFILGSCRKGVENNSAEQRQQWLDSLNDSIATLNKIRSNDSIEIISLRNKIDDELPQFAEVNNPREVEPYYILSSFRGSYPLSSTGIAARMLKSQQLELIAALSGRKFNSISVACPDGSKVNSNVVPADQALNYTAANLTTVAFSGQVADSIGGFVAKNIDSPLTLRFLQAGSVVNSIQLSDAQKRWIATTWNLTNCRARLDSLEKAQLLNARKIQLLYLTLKKD